MKRWLRAVAGVAALLCVPAAASAQTSTLAIERVLRSNGLGRIPSGTDGTTLPIGRRDCGCDSWQFRVRYTAGTGAQQIEYWMGTNSSACTTATSRYPNTNPTCWPIRSQAASPVGQLGMSNFVDITIPSEWLIDPLGGTCNPVGSTSTTGSYYFFALMGPLADSPVSASYALTYSTTVPDPPLNISASAGNESLTVAWDYGTTTVDGGLVSVPQSLQGFYVMCFPSISFDPGTSATCSGGQFTGDAGDAGDASLDGATAGDAASDATDDLVSTTDGGTDAGTDASTACISVLPAGFDPNDDTQMRLFQCSSRLSRDTRSYRLSGLTNGQPYNFAVVAEDNAGNRKISGLMSSCVSPVETTNFWEHYRNAGGRAEPGFCAVRPASIGRGNGWTSLLGLAGALVLLGSRTFRRTRRGEDGR